ncbi:MAG: HAD family hydrolase, partial [Thermodesulfobacteriota bacterium]
MKSKTPQINAILFDFDGTLTKPGALCFPEIKNALGCPLSTPILEFIEGLENPHDQESARKMLNGFEMKAASLSEPNPGAEELIRYLKTKGIFIGIITRNSIRSIDRAFQNFREIRPDDFDIIVSRDLPIAPKPSPDAILYVMEKLNIEASRILMVGDYVFDIISGKNAGVWTVWLKNDAGIPAPVPESDYTV